MRLPLVRKMDEIRDLDIAVVGVPFDGGVTNRPGARHGPREVRNSSTMMRSINHATKVNPYEFCRVADVGDVPFTRIYDLSASHDEIAHFFSQLASMGVTPLAVGGDHSITYPIFRGLAEGAANRTPSYSDPRLGMVHIDAHTDTWDVFMEEKLNHGAPFRRAVENNLLDPARTIQIGIRGAQNVDEGWRYSQESGMKVLFIEDVRAMGVEAVIAEARRVVGDGPTYVSFDIDALDPAYAPGTGTPEVGGMDPLQAMQVLRGLRGLDLVGADVVEVSPPFDHANLTAMAGATIAYELLCLLSESAAKRS